MCGRKTLTKGIKSIIENLTIDEWEDAVNYAPSFNIAPGQLSPVVIQKEHRIVKSMKWGLVPSWAKDVSVGYKMINARSETLTEKPSYQELVSKHRCVVISDGYYEWKREGKRKIPYYIPNAQELLNFLASFAEFTRFGPKVPFWKLSHFFAKRDFAQKCTFWSKPLVGAKGVIFYQ